MQRPSLGGVATKLILPSYSPPAAGHVIADCDNDRPCPPSQTCSTRSTVVMTESKGRSKG
jgi:hypothetical protein